jgi:hypothetical protein
MAKRTKPDGGLQPNNAIMIKQAPDETGAQAMARTLLEPQLRNGITASYFAGKALGRDVEGPGITDFADHMQTATSKAEAGDLAIASRMLAAQAITLDSMFTELARRAALNMGEYINAAERYGRLALKAQSNCRATLEALVRLHQPREQTVRHVHVNDGGRAVIADQIHHHGGGAGNAETTKQSDAAGPARSGASLLGADPERDGMPVTRCERQEAMSDARRHEPRGA